MQRKIKQFNKNICLLLQRDTQFARSLQNNSCHPYSEQGSQLKESVKEYRVVRPRSSCLYNFSTSQDDGVGLLFEALYKLQVSKMQGRRADRTSY